MAIAFIFVAIVLIFVLMLFSFHIESYPLMMLSAMGMIILGVTTLASGIGDINDILTLGLGTIFTFFGAYIFINGSVEKIRAEMD